MIKKLVIISLILIFVFPTLGCAADITKKEIFSYFNLTKNELLKKLGDNYEIVNTGAEGSFDGYEYKSLGITIIFNYDDTVNFIECDKKVSIDGARAGMNFKQIQKSLGKTPIIKTWYESPSHDAYKIEYMEKGYVLMFYSFEKDGTNSNLTIYKKAPKEK